MVISPLKKRGLALYAFLLCSQSLANGLIYTREDLETLYQQKNAAEFFAHAKDLRPKERDSKWKKMLLDLLEKEIQKANNTTLYSTILPILAWPDIQEEEKTNYLYGLATKQKIASCQSEGSFEKCFKDLENLWPKLEKNPERGDIGLSILQAFASSNEEYPDDIWALFSHILDSMIRSKVSEFYCEKELVQDLYFRHIKKDLASTGAELDKSLWWKKIQASCLKKMTSFLKNKMMGAMNLSDHYTAFQMLQKHSLLTPVEQSAYLVSFLLYGPLVGDDFNRAWNTLKKMKENYSFRLHVFRELKNYKLLPGAIFASPDRQKRKVIVEQILAAFPEYVDYYLETCQQFYSGSKAFPYGNPVPHCVQAMETLSSLKKYSNYSSAYLKLKEHPKFKSAPLLRSTSRENREKF
jgi:hypothetical protein